MLLLELGPRIDIPTLQTLNVPNLGNTLSLLDEKGYIYLENNVIYFNNYDLLKTVSEVLLDKTQKENIELGKAIVEFISKKDKELTTKEIREHFGVTAQKVTPILTKLVEENSLTKRVDKRVSYYKVA